MLQQAPTPAAAARLMSAPGAMASVGTAAHCKEEEVPAGRELNGAAETAVVRGVSAGTGDRGPSDDIEFSDEADEEEEGEEGLRAANEFLRQLRMRAEGEEEGEGEDGGKGTAARQSQLQRRQLKVQRRGGGGGGRGSNPLHWFGVLVPPALKDAQGQFIAGGYGPAVGSDPRVNIRAYARATLRCSGFALPSLPTSFTSNPIVWKNPEQTMAHSGVCVFVNMREYSEDGEGWTARSMGRTRPPSEAVCPAFASRNLLPTNVHLGSLRSVVLRPTCCRPFAWGGVRALISACSLGIVFLLCAMLFLI